MALNLQEVSSYTEEGLKTLYMAALYKLVSRRYLAFLFFQKHTLKRKHLLVKIHRKTLREEILLSTTGPQFAINQPYIYQL